jgi:hypothetical protein
MGDRKSDFLPAYRGFLRRRIRIAACPWWGAVS